LANRPSPLLRQREPRGPAAAAGAKRVIAVDPVEFKREKAMEMGATHTYSSIEEAALAVPELTWGEMCDAVILVPGVVTGDMVEPALGLTAKGGTLVVTGLAPMMETDAQINLFMFSMMNKEVKGTVFGSGNPRADIPKLLGLYREGQLDLDGLVTKEYKLSEWQTAFDQVEQLQKKGRILLDIGGSENAKEQSV
jgi:S-(hydroxymethyl)glutathione dehydrogenase/alcohol dehydrogenase